MITQERYFDELFEYVDLWAGGFVKAHVPNAEGEMFLRLRSRVTEALMDRFDTINRLRKSIGLKAMSVEDCYNYYVNNLPDYDDRKNTIDLYSYDVKTRELGDKEDDFKDTKSAVAFLYVMGAPEEFIDNSQVVQERLDHINRLMVEGGYNAISAQKTEEILTKLLIENY